MGKTIKKELSTLLHPRYVKILKIEGRPIEHEVLRSVNVFFITYILLFTISFLIISLDKFDFITHFSAAASTFNNIGQMCIRDRNRRRPPLLYGSSLPQSLHRRT